MARYDHGGGCPCGLYAECEPNCDMLKLYGGQMTWEDVPLPDEGRHGKRGNREAAPFMVTVSRQGRSDNYRLVIIGWPQFIPNGDLDWWKQGVRVTVQTDNQGGLRITQSDQGKFTLAKTGNHPKSPAGVRLALPKHLPPAPRDREALPYELGLRVVTVRLPAWAVSTSSPFRIAS